MSEFVFSFLLQGCVLNQLMRVHVIQELAGLLKLWLMLGELTVPTASCLVFLTVAGNSLPSFFRFLFKTSCFFFSFMESSTSILLCFGKKRNIVESSQVNKQLPTWDILQRGWSCESLQSSQWWDNNIHRHIVRLKFIRALTVNFVKLWEIAV